MPQINTVHSYSVRTTLTEPSWFCLYRPGLRCAEPTNAVPRAADKTFVSSPKYPNRNLYPNSLLFNRYLGTFCGGKVAGA